MGFAVLLVSFVPLTCLGAAVAGALCAADTGGAVGFVKYLAALAVSFLWIFLGTLVLLGLDLHSLSWNLAVYVPWGAAGTALFYPSLRKTAENRSAIGRAGAVSGMIAGVLFCVMSAAAVRSGGGNVENHLHDLCLFFLKPVGLFLPAFALTALGSGALRKKWSGVIENLLLLAIAPAGLYVALAVSALITGLYSVESGVPVSTSIALALWLLCIFWPYGYMTLRARRKKDELGFCNGIAGLGAVVFFLLGLGLLGYIGRGV